MASARGFTLAARLAWATAALLFGLMILGSVVRTTGSGLACPDWPLCGGRLIPPFEFHVLLEWSHRLVALLASGMVVATLAAVLARPAVRARLGWLAGLSVLLLGVQVLLGALTVWHLLAPSVVGGHLAVALLLLGSMLALALAAGSAGADRGAETAPPAPRAPGSLALAVAAVAAYGQCLLGAAVSSTGAGTACATWPTCDGAWFPPLEGAVGIQMTHRYGAYLLIALVTIAAVRARRAPDPAVRAATRAAVALVLVQATLGIAAVLLGVPPWLSALHLGAAVLLVGVLFAGALRSAGLPALSVGLAPLGAR